MRAGTESRRLVRRPAGHGRVGVGRRRLPAPACCEENVVYQAQKDEAGELVAALQRHMCERCPHVNASYVCDAATERNTIERTRALKALGPVPHNDMPAMTAPHASSMSNECTRHLSSDAPTPHSRLHRRRASVGEKTCCNTRCRLSQASPIKTQQGARGGPCPREWLS